MSTTAGDLQRDLVADDTDSRVRMWLCDVADRRQVDEVFRQARAGHRLPRGGVQAHPVMEDHPDAAFRTNVVAR
jgi:FlaA1/EpsC-like NDP-sugar epimerase